MALVVLDEGLTARLAALARRCGVSPETVPLAGLALLLRRYTGRTQPSVRARGGVAFIVDLARDGPVREVVARVHPTGGERLTDADGNNGPFADVVDVSWELDGPRWQLSIVDCPSELADPFAADLVSMLAAMAEDPDGSTVDLLPESAYERRAHKGNAPAQPTNDQALGGDTIPAAFAATVARYPDRPAVLAADECLTYRQLGAAVAATAAAIRGFGGTSPFAILCRHGAGTITGLLGALTAGRPYVPLDPAFPVPRLAQIIADSRPGVLLTDDTHAELAARLAADLPTIQVGQSSDLTDLTTTARPDDPAYLLYTSGSTGAPKGVVQSHRNVLFGVANHVSNFAITPDDRLSVLTSFGYDMAVTDTFGALLSGAAAVPIDIRAHGLGHLGHALAERRVTLYHSTPTVYRYLIASLCDGTLPDIRVVLLGGEEVTRHDVALARRHFAPDTVFVNGYGTTEISFATQCHLPPDAPLDHAVVPIGYPLEGIEVVLVDGAGNPVCLTGEIVVRSPFVALGYHGLPELTASRFVDRGGVRAYRTGDLARRLPDGRLVFLGRVDRQVKIRGHRVELGEVEARLAALPGVGQAVVVARVDPRGDKEIIGYVVPGRGGTVEPTAIRAALAAALPDFMVPRVVVVVPALPMGSTGKLDVAALPAPPAGSTVDAGKADPLEGLISAVWCDVLGVPRVNRSTTFVELGGHSLLMALVQQRLEAALGRRLPLTRLFEFPTVAGLATHLRTDRPDTSLDQVTDRMARRRTARQVVP